MYQVNLLPWRQQAQRRRGIFWLRLLVVQLVLALTISALVLGCLRYQQHQLRVQWQQKAKQYGELMQQQRQIQAAVAKLARLTALETQRQRNRMHNQRYPQLLQQLAAALPEPLWLVALEENSQMLTLRGLSLHYPAVVQLTRNLAARALLPGHRLAEVAQRKDGLFTFTLMAPRGRDE